VSDTIKCTCANCGAKYRLPLESAGRTARCKKCGEKFQIPAERSVEDSVLDWLSEAAEEEAVEQPRVINMPKSSAADADALKKSRGPIRLKQPTTPNE
jgi:DNA-directed RNA polymerase subunit RPC12/RpoP